MTCVTVNKHEVIVVILSHLFPSHLLELGLAFQVPPTSFFSASIRLPSLYCKLTLLLTLQTPGLSANRGIYTVAVQDLEGKHQIMLSLCA